MILNSPTISGSLTVTGNIITSGSITISGSIASASYATNAELLDGLDSTAFATTGAYSATSASLYATSASLSATSGSLSATSGSLSATSGSLSATSGSLSTASGSFDSRVATIESKYATTGSNTFTSTQVVSGSILQSGSFTTTGTIIAQTINVQTVTSSVVYSSGSNVFGNSIGNSQTFTGSVLITGSLTIAGNITSNGAAFFAGAVCVSNIISTGTSGGRYATFSAPSNGGYITFDAGGTAFGDLGSYCAQYGTGDATTLLLGTRTGYALALGTNSTERLRITSTGVVGIGTNAPVTDDGNLVVVGCVGTGQGTANTVAQINIWETTSANKAGLWFGSMTNATTGVIGSRTATGNIAFQTYCGGWAERMRIAYNGNVGIGTSSPVSFFSIGTYGSAGKYIDSSTLPTTPSNYLITLAPPSTTGYYGGGIGWSEGSNTAAGINAYDDGAGGALGLSFATGTNSGLTERMRITNCGNVGIGINPTSTFFQVSGNSPDNIAWFNNTQSNGYASARFYNDGNKAAVFGVGGSAVGAPYANNGYIYTDSGVDLAFAMGGVERMRITSTGIATFTCQVCAPHLIGLNNISIGSSCTTSDGYNTRLRITNIANDTFVFSFNNQACKAIMFMYGGNVNNPQGYTAWLDNTSGNANHTISHNTAENTSFAVQGGKVGIGTATPNEKLDVNGVVQVRGSSLGYATTQCVGMLDFYASATRLLSFGGDATTCGCFRFYSAGQNNNGGSDVATISGGGAACFKGTVCAPSIKSTGTIIGANFITDSGTAAISTYSVGYSTFYTAQNYQNAIYLVTLQLNGYSGYTAFATIAQNDSSLVIMNQVNNTAYIQVSGLNIQGSQNSGITQSMVWKLIKIA